MTATLDCGTGQRLTEAVLTVDLEAIAANWRWLGRQAAAHVRVGSVVKADAYGLGAREVAPALYGAGCRDFFVATASEALDLCAILPPPAAVYVFHGALPGVEEDLADKGVVPVLNSLDQIGRWRRTARRRGERLRAAIHVDTGFSRLGLSPRELDELDEHASREIDVVLILSHLVSAGDPCHPLNALQRQRLAAARRRFPHAKASLANSPGIFLGAGWHFEMLRPGAALLGVKEWMGGRNPMRPVVRLQAPLLMARDVPEGEGINYGHAWRARRATRAGILQLGYADGYPRTLRDGGRLRFEDFEVPIIGLTMDTTTVDLTDLPPAVQARACVPGAAYDALGPSPLDVDTVAARAGTIPADLLTGLGHRFRRAYL